MKTIINKNALLIGGIICLVINNQDAIALSNAAATAKSKAQRAAAVREAKAQRAAERRADNATRQAQSAAATDEVRKTDVPAHKVKESILGAANVPALSSEEVEDLLISKPEKLGGGCKLEVPLMSGVYYRLETKASDGTPVIKTFGSRIVGKTSCDVGKSLLRTCTKGDYDYLYNESDKDRARDQMVSYFKDLINSNTWPCGAAPSFVQEQVSMNGLISSGKVKFSSGDNGQVICLADLDEGYFRKPNCSSEKILSELPPETCSMMFKIARQQLNIGSLEPLTEDQAISKNMAGTKKSNYKAYVTYKNGRVPYADEFLPPELVSIISDNSPTSVLKKVKDANASATLDQLDMEFLIHIFSFVLTNEMIRGTDYVQFSPNAQELAGKLKPHYDRFLAANSSNARIRLHVYNLPTKDSFKQKFLTETRSVYGIIFGESNFNLMNFECPDLVGIQLNVPSFFNDIVLRQTSDMSFLLEGMLGDDAYRNIDSGNFANIINRPYFPRTDFLKLYPETLTRFPSLNVFDTGGVVRGMINNGAVNPGLADGVQQNVGGDVMDEVQQNARNIR